MKVFNEFGDFLGDIAEPDSGAGCFIVLLLGATVGLFLLPFVLAYYVVLLILNGGETTDNAGLDKRFIAGLVCIPLGFGIWVLFVMLLGG